MAPRVQAAVRPVQTLQVHVTALEVLHTVQAVLHIVLLVPGIVLQALAITQLAPTVHQKVQATVRLLLTKLALLISLVMLLQVLNTRPATLQKVHLLQNTVLRVLNCLRDKMPAHKIKATLIRAQNLAHQPHPTQMARSLLQV